MTDEGNSKHLSVVITMEAIVDITVTDSTATNIGTPSSSYGIEFYFQCAVVVIGVAGTAANALILYAMVASKQHKKHVLIFNQNLLDFFSCLFLIITYAIKLCNIYLTGYGGYLFCQFVVSENLTWCTSLASKTNIFFVTIERYLKTVFPVWSKNKLRKWMIYSALAVAWISGIVHVMALTFFTTDVIDGVCYAYVVWKSPMAQMGYGISYFLSYYTIELLTFIFCYGHILIAIRRQAKVMAGHGAAGSSAVQAKSNQIQSSIIKTMILVSAFYAISDLPINVHYLILSIHRNMTLLESAYYALLFISFLYYCTNPFIYALKFDPVKRILLRLIPCKKSSVDTLQVVDTTGAPNVQTHAETRNF